MDTSETYIKMCEKATEIQALRDMQTLQKGDFYWHSWMGEAVPSRYEHGTEVMCRILDYTSELGGYRCWLPRQDQLQEMLSGIYVDSTPRKLAKAIWDWVAQSAPPSDWSMEQLWLAFVMKEKHNKVWNGEDWSSQS